ncbi:MAG TPA: hypothetical protein VGC09_14080 [Rhodopila sp.]
MATQRAQQKRGSRGVRGTARLRRHQPEAEVPPVPVFQPVSDTKPAEPALPEADPNEEMVRRMIEAAYT